MTGGPIRIGFYHLQRWPLEMALPKLLERAYSAGHRTLVMAGSPERVAALDSLLWTYQPDSWLPHGTKKDGAEDAQPIYLTDQDENPNGADFLVLTDGVTSARLESFTRAATLFDGRDEGAVAAARETWRGWKEKGFDLHYYQQTEQGGWEEKGQ
jgi:DNA polymerase-3 subunit chi